MKYFVNKMSHLGQTADLAGEGFHNTSLSRLKDEMTRKIYWKLIEKKFHCASSWPQPNLGHLLSAAQNWSRQEHNPLVRIEVENAQFCTFPLFPKAEVVIHEAVDHHPKSGSPIHLFLSALSDEI